MKTYSIDARKERIHKVYASDGRSANPYRTRKRAARFLSPEESFYSMLSCLLSSRKSILQIMKTQHSPWPRLHQQCTPGRLITTYQFPTRLPALRTTYPRLRLRSIVEQPSKMAVRIKRGAGHEGESDKCVLGAGTWTELRRSSRCSLVGQNPT